MTSYQSYSLEEPQTPYTITSLDVSEDSIAIRATGPYIYHGPTDWMQVYQRNPQSGSVVGQGQYFSYDVPGSAPSDQVTLNSQNQALAISPDGQFAAIVSVPNGSGTPILTVYTRDQATGLFSDEIASSALQNVPGSDITLNQVPAQETAVVVSQILFSPDDTSIYLLAGTNASQPANEVISFSLQARGTEIEQPLQPVSTYYDGEFSGALSLAGASTMALASNGQNLYVAVNHGSSIVIFQTGDYGQLTANSQYLYHSAFPTFLPGQAGTAGGSLAVTPDGSQLLVTSDLNKTLSIFQLDANGIPTYTGVQTLNRFIGAEGVAVSPNGQFAYVVGNGSMAELSQVNGQWSIDFFYGGLGQASFVGVTPDGNYVYTSNTAPSTTITVFAVTDSFGDLAEYNQIKGGSTTGADGRQLFSTFTTPAIGPGDTLEVAGTNNAGVAIVQQTVLSQIMQSGVGGALFQQGSSPLQEPFNQSDVAVQSSVATPRYYTVDSATSSVTVFGPNTLGAYYPLQSLQDGEVVGGHLLTELAGAQAVAISPDNANLYVAIAGNNSTPPGIAVFGLDTNPNDASFGLITAFVQLVPNADMTGVVRLEVSGDGKSVYALGTGNNILWTLNRNPATGALQAVQTLTSAPTTFNLAYLTSVTPSPDGNTVYGVSPEDGALATLVRNAQGNLVLQSVILEGEQFPGNQVVTGLSVPVATALSPDGSTVYVLSQGDSAISIFSRNYNISSPDYGQLSFVGTVSDPALATGTGLTVSPDGQSVYVTTNSSPEVVLFQRNPTSGMLTLVPSIVETGDATTLQALENINDPSAVAISPDSSTVYITGSADNSINVFQRVADPTSPYFGASDLRADDQGWTDAKQPGGLRPGWSGVRQRQPRRHSRLCRGAGGQCRGSLQPRPGHRTADVPPGSAQWSQRSPWHRRSQRRCGQHHADDQQRFGPAGAAAIRLRHRRHRQRACGLHLGHNARQSQLRAIDLRPAAGE